MENITTRSNMVNEQERLKLVELIKTCSIAQNEHNLVIPSHRRHQFISFDEYKQRLVNGECTQDIISNTSKHIVCFYNYMLKNHANIISRDVFESEYNTGIGLEGISKKYNIPRENVTYLRDFYGIKRKGATFIKRLTNEKPLSQEAKDVIIGSLLGDGCIDKCGVFREKHSAEQVGYLEWKAEVLRETWNDRPLTAYLSIDKRSGTKIYTFQFIAGTHSFTLDARSEFYKNGIKCIPENIKDYINELTLAIWFMDDGSTDWHYRKGVKLYNSLPTCKICSESFTQMENETLSKIIYEKFGLVSRVGQKLRSPQQTRIYFDSESSLKLVNLLKKYATPDLLYKYDEQEYLKRSHTVLDKDKILSDYRIRHQLI